MRIFQNKIFIGGACIILAAVFAFLILPGLYKSKGKTIKVIKLNHDISSGVQINEDMLSEHEIGSYGLPESVVTDKDAVIGKYSNCSIKSEDLILTSKLSDFAADERLDKIHSNCQKLL